MLTKLGAPFFLVYKLWIGVVFWITLMVLFPFFWILLQKKRYFPLAFKLKKVWSRLLQILLFCPVKVVNKKPLPLGSFVICSNHQSYLDTVFMFSVVPDYFVFVGKAELKRWPLFGYFFKEMDIPVDRRNHRESQKSMQRAAECLQAGESVAIFPEGTVPDEVPTMRKFKNGAFKLAIENQVPIVPVTWIDNYRVMHDPMKLLGFSLPKRVVAIVHDPIPTVGLSEMDVVSLRERVFEIIEKPLKS